MTNIDINTVLPERDIFYFAKQKKKNASILPKKPLRPISSECSICFIDSMFGGRFFNTQSAFLWIPTMFLFSTTSLFIRMHKTTYRSISKKAKKD